MASQNHCMAEDLAEVFRRSQDEIIDEWRSQTGKLLRELNLDKPTITDHLPDVIAEITRDLARTRRMAAAKRRRSWWVKTNPAAMAGNCEHDAKKNCAQEFLAAYLDRVNSVR